MGSFRQRLFHRGVLIFLLRAAGVCCVGAAFYNLAKTAVYVHQSIVVPATVQDVRRCYFNSQAEALSHGNLSWAGDVAYQPVTAFDMPGGIRIRRLEMPDLDNEDYHCGQQVEVITPPHDPNKAHLYKWKFLWGGDCILLGMGLMLCACGWLPRIRQSARKGGKESHSTPSRRVEEKPIAPEKPRRQRSVSRKKSSSSASEGEKRASTQRRRKKDSPSSKTATPLSGEGKRKGGRPQKTTSPSSKAG